jgi:RNA methyltransferase, TrmH family
MLSKAKIKLINQLKQKKYRQIHNMFIAEGSKNTLDFINSNNEIIEIFATSEWLDINQPPINNKLINEVNKSELKKITALSTPSDVLAIFSLPSWHKSKPQIKENDFCIALDDISDPGNLGTIIRTADWFGITDIYCSENTVDVFNPKVVQSTMGSLTRVRVNYTNLKKLFETRPEDVPVFGATLNGQPVDQIGNIESGVILIGSEAHGISKHLIPLIDKKITIPMLNTDQNSKPESLNASIANAIICYALKIRS